MTNDAQTKPAKQPAGWQISIRTDDALDLHKRFKVATAIAGTTQQDALAELIRGYCEERGQ